jgi:hypothetical protein
MYFAIFVVIWYKYPFWYVLTREIWQPWSEHLYNFPKEKDFQKSEAKGYFIITNFGDLAPLLANTQKMIFLKIWLLFWKSVAVARFFANA